MKTKVLFLKERDDNDVFAYFPEMVSDYKGNKSCYAHIGQHSGCSPDYAKECIEAKYHEYHDLLKELIGIGYNLEIMNESQDTITHEN